MSLLQSNLESAPTQSRSTTWPKIASRSRNQVAWESVKGKGFSLLLSGPFCRWMGGHIEMENAPTVMSQHQKHLEGLETNCGHREEINGDELRDVVV